MRVADAGFDSTEPRRLKHAGQLSGWEALRLNYRDYAPVGSAATCGHGQKADEEP
jgi:hypothetical protein